MLLCTRVDILSDSLCLGNDELGAVLTLLWDRDQCRFITIGRLFDALKDLALAKFRAKLSRCLLLVVWADL